MTVEKQKFSKTDSTVVKFKVTNTGKTDGDEVSQLYIRDLWSSVARPLTELKGFKRINLKAGETKEVSFTITPDLLLMLNDKMKWVVEPGEFRLMIGASCNDIRLRGIINVE
ncbi:MAG: fibronectin type III-like domain-contianing protein [Candidatus Falkowbacteria bacterium]